MRKFLLLMAASFLTFQLAWAQSTVSGQVTDDGGEPLEGVAVIGEGTNTGAFTDADGRYSIDVPSGVTTLLFRYVGKLDQKVEITGGTMNVSMQADDVYLDEVVVTALGLKREERSLGYAVQEISGEDASYVRDQNVVSGLTGKIAGVQVISASGAQLGGSAKIRIRGANGLGGGNPLFVIDGTPMSNGNFSASYRGVDYGNLAQDVNPDDIESITVLKGPAATALYGNRASEGAIVITTKKGGARKGVGININSSVQFDNVYVLPNYQNEYAGGYTQEYLTWTDPVDGQDYNVLNYAADESWGPKIDGTTQYRPWWSWFPGEDYGKQIAMTANPNNVRDFFDTGITYNNNVSFSGGNQNTSFRASYSNIQQTGVIPNSSLNRNNLNVNASSQLSDKLTISTSLNFATTAGKGRPSYGYVGNNAVLSFNQWFQRQLDMDKLRDYRNPDGTLRSWNIRSPENLRPLYWDSPFFSVMENFPTDSRDRYFGNITLAYELTDNITVKGIVRRDKYTQRIETRTASGGLSLDSYSEFVAEGQEDNYEGLITYDNQFGDLSINVNLGGNIRKNTFHSNSMATAGGLNAPNLFNIAASTDRPTVNSFISEKIVNSIYGFATLGYRDMLYLDFTLRNDWSSALPADNNSYLYPSVSASFIFSELWAQNEIFSFGKIRLSYAQTGSDVGPYATNFTYSAGTPYGSTSTFSLPNQLVNEELRPALSSAYEAGLDLRFFNNRVGVDIAVYQQVNIDQILSITVPGSSGFSSALINAGNITSRGVEIALNATPVRNDNLTWDMNLNWARNRSEVIELADGIDNRRLDGWGWGGFSINAPVGEEWGTMRGRGYAIYENENDPNDPANGQRIVNENGYVFENNKTLGTLLPDFTGGFRNTLVFKGVELTAFVEFQKGGSFHSVTKMFNAYSGLSEETVGMNDKGFPLRDPVDQGGGVKVEGVTAEGETAEYYVEAQSYFSGNLFALNERWIYDQSYVKLRELRVGYTIPKKLLGSSPIQDLSLAVIGRNLWLIHSNVDGIDPSEISPGSNGYVFQENGILPSTRSIGVNLRLGF
ncbi:MAG: SusC/RagA family TonB-linked outer membrane protein [Bacteroidota bacterium]